ncbi:hypothetical protein EI94DRAFT_1576962 [Lactarius quietus]|nr:hypothetical protein EI94DRAFT_1576962 [Lactarius quietus]
MQYTLTSVQYKDILSIVNMQHDYYSCKCQKMGHSAMQQEHDKTGNMHPLVDHNPEA